jgi:hypothetical protein
MDPFYSTIAGLVFVGIILILPVFTCLRRAKAELNLKPLWQKRCTGYLGAFGTNIPSIRVALYQDFLVIGFISQTVIPYRDIGKVSVNRRFWSLRGSGVDIKLRGMSSGYHFNLNLRDSTAFMDVIKPQLLHRSRK